MDKGAKEGQTTTSLCVPTTFWPSTANHTVLFSLYCVLNAVPQERNGSNMAAADANAFTLKDALSTSAGGVGTKPFKLQALSNLHGAMTSGEYEHDPSEIRLLQRASSEEDKSALLDFVKAALLSKKASATEVAAVFVDIGAALSNLDTADGPYASEEQDEMKAADVVAGIYKKAEAHFNSKSSAARSKGQTGLGIKMTVASLVVEINPGTVSSCPACNHASAMGLVNQSDLDYVNAQARSTLDVKRAAHSRLVSQGQANAKSVPRASGTSAERTMPMGCQCSHQNCHLNSNGVGCVLCVANGGPTMVDGKCDCGLCKCPCEADWHKGNEQKVAAAIMVKATAAEQGPGFGAASDAISSLMAEACRAASRNQAALQGMIHESSSSRRQSRWLSRPSCPKTKPGVSEPKHMAGSYVAFPFGR